MEILFFKQLYFVVTSIFSFFFFFFFFFWLSFFFLILIFKKILFFFLFFDFAIFKDLGVRVFANGPGDLGSIPGRVIPKTQKMVLDASLLNTQHYKVRIKGKVEQSREGVAPSPTHWCSSYRKGSLRVTLDYGRQLYLLTLLRDFFFKSQSLFVCSSMQSTLWWIILFSVIYVFVFY